MSERRWTRRHAMTAMGGAAILAPFWKPLRAGAQGAMPKRIITIFVPNGVVDDEFFPSGGERDFQLKRGLAPLEPFRNKIMVVRGVDLKVQGPGDAHKRGTGGLFTGRPLRSNTPSGYPRGISVDQRVADEIGGATRFPSIQAAVAMYTDSQTNTRMSYREGGVPLAPEKDPRRLFNRLFDGFVPAGNTPDPRQEFRARLRRSILDRSTAELQELRRRLGREDAARLDFHAETLRELEVRLSETPTTSASCTLPGEVSGSLNLHQDYLDPVVLRHMQEIIVRAFACDLTRVASLAMGRGSTPVVPPGLGIGGSHHSLAHNGARSQLVRIDEWYASRVADLLELLDSVPEGGGTLLDNTLIMWGNELRDGQNHRYTSLPLVLAGGAGGAIEMGRYLSFNGASLNDFLTSVVHAFDIRENFGDPRWTNGPLF